MAMRTFILLAFTMTLACCHSQKGKKLYYFASVGWHIWIADTISVTDSAKHHKFDNVTPPPYKYDPANPPDSSVPSPGEERRPGSSTSTVTDERQSPLKLLLRFTYPTGQWSLNAASMSATIRPMSMIPKGYEQYLEDSRNEMVNMFKNSIFPATKTDTSSGTEKISNRIFHKQEYALHRDNLPIYYFVVYSAVINNYLFEAGISYRNEKDKKDLLSIWRSSSFKR
jgi:hypothetical protein